jgi:hypothetical protein
MAFTNLTRLTQEEYDALNLSPLGKVNKTLEGSPDPSVDIELGGWVGDSVLAFTVSNAAQTASGTTIDLRESDTLDVQVIDATNPGAVISYFTVDVGSDNKTTDWTVSYAVKKKTTTTGKWVFTKGKGDEDFDPTR